ncbi:hypothetical protein FRC01_001617 [Tulasnella sp. 417]|nr:hypothetical protein FRC01_001617 [Tulasnella sp. 417]
MDSPPSDPEVKRKALVKRVWGQCWEEFQSWKEQFASNEIAAAAVGKSTALQVKQEQDSQSDAALPVLDGVNIGLEDEIARVALSSNRDMLTVWRFPSPADGESGDALPISHRIPVYPCDPVNDVLKPVAPYESCVPMNQNVQVVNTAAEFELLEFIPFGNEPRFLEEHPDVLQDGEDGSKRSRFKWELPDRDPDLDVVVCEAARRLHINYNLSFNDIDATGILPRGLVMEYGKVWDPLTSRTMLPWPPRPLLDPNPNYKSLIPSEPIPSTEQRLSRMSNLMCASLGCIQPACPVHASSQEGTPKLDENDRGMWETDEALWSDAELHELGDVWESWNASSGLSVCMLARMVFKPCWEKLHDIKGPFDMLDAPQDSPDESPQSKKKTKKSQASKKQGRKKKLDFTRHRAITQARANQASTAYAIGQCIAARGIAPAIRHVLVVGKDVLVSAGPVPVGQQNASARKTTGNATRNCVGPAAPERTRVIMKDYEWGPGWGLELAESAEDEEFIDGEEQTKHLPVL